jgi:DNA-binding MarR family transcriptional regulator
LLKVLIDKYYFFNMKNVSKDKPIQPEDASPWADLDELGSGLTVDHFLTTMVSQVINGLRRTVTLPYAEAFGVTVPEWRLLSLLAYAKSLPFAELVVQSTSDKALVSRTVRRLEAQGLVTIHAEGSTPRKKLTCVITPAGEAFHDKVIPTARQAQATMIRLLTPTEREVTYRALKKLHAHCMAIPENGKTSAGE